MAAIYGLLGDNDEGLLRAMGGRLRHRGRASAERAVSPRALFGRTIGTPVFMGEYLHEESTSILTSGHLTLVADADLYNAAEVRSILSRAGRGFHTDRADEIILEGYAELGPRVFEYLNGDFAVAIWDDESSTLSLARDPLGMRPLYYWLGPGRVAFASEYKALLALPFVPATVDSQAIQELQYSKYPPPNHTLLRGIVSVPPGHVVDYRAGATSQRRYWQVHLDVKGGSEAEHEEITRRELLAAVERRLTDLNVAGATLSGGIDSAAVVAAIRKVRPDLPLHTFTCGYGPHDPEVRTAAITAEAMGTDHHPLYVQPEKIPETLPELVWHLEDPIARSEVVLIYETARLAAQHVDVVLAGYVSDALYAGMSKHKIIKLMQRLPWLRDPLEEFYQYTQVSANPPSLAGKLVQLAHYRGTNAPPPPVSGASVPDHPARLPGGSDELINRVLQGGLQTGTPRWLPKAERLHIAHGLRVRSPYTDVSLIRSAFRIPDRYKIRGWREKYILRQAVKPWLPSSVLNRPKFPQAMNYNLAFSEVLDFLAEEYLNTDALKSRGFFTRHAVDRLLVRPANKAYSAERAMRIWSVILTELWARIFVDGRGRPVTAYLLTEDGEAEPHGGESLCVSF